MILSNSSIPRTEHLVRLIASVTYFSYISHKLLYQLGKYKPTCFLIDDDIDDQELFEMALKEVDKNIKYSVANDGVEALRRFEEDATFVPDIIFLDVNMPKMNGLQCLTHLKKLPQLKEVKIIMYSTSSDRAELRKAKNLALRVSKPSLPASRR